MTPGAPDVYVRAIRRIERFIIILGAVGAAETAWLRGWRFGLGFLMGAGVSYISFRRWRRVVEALGTGPARRSPWLLALWFGVVAAASYGIVKYLEVNAVAVFLGLLVPAAAVLITLIFELIYAR